MPCRIGITTNLESRKNYWKNRVTGFSNWRILETHQTKQAAQEAETRLAELHRCMAHQGGEDASPPWYVYKFSYTRDPGPN